jgi:4-methyl-5(b-hydroxyethyl)-thiazole monophosphate biosynthesis
LEIEKINLQDFCALAIVGGFEKAIFYKDVYGERLLNLIREFDKEGKIIAAIFQSESLES